MLFSKYCETFFCFFFLFFGSFLFWFFFNACDVQLRKCQSSYYMQMQMQTHIVAWKVFVYMFQKLERVKIICYSSCMKITKRYRLRTYSLDRLINPSLNCAITSKYHWQGKVVFRRATQRACYKENYSQWAIKRQCQPNLIEFKFIKKNPVYP